MNRMFPRRWIAVYSCSLLIAAMAAQDSLASWNASLARGQLEQMNSESQASLHQLMKKAYIGYLGVEGEFGQPDPLDGHTLFSDLNDLLQEEVEPQIRNGKQLSETYWQREGDRSYLDQFTVRELRVRGLIFSNAEDYRQARQSLSEAVTLATRMGDTVNLAFALNNLSYSNFHLQRVEEAIQNLRQAIELAQEMKDARASSLFHYNLGWIHLNAGQWEAAVPLFETAARVSQQHSLPIRRMAALINLGSIYLSQGDPEKARQVFFESHQMARQVNSLRFRAMSALDYSIVLILEDRYQEAARLLDEALFIFKEQGRVFMRGERSLLEQKALRLLRSLDEKTAGAIVSSHLDGQVEPVQVASQSLHSHFAHLFMTPAAFTATVPLAVRPASPPSAPLQAAGGQVRISMKSLTVPTNEPFNMPVYFAIPSGVELASLTFQVTYPKEALLFSDLEKGFLLQSGFKTETRTDPHPSEEALDVLKVSVSSEGGPSAPLPSGLVLYLSFRVAEKVDQGSVFLHNETVEAETTAGRSLPESRLAAKDQAITILGEDMVPTILCFFYIH